MGEAQQTIAVAGGTPFAFVLAGLLSADHGRKVYLVAQKPSGKDVPPPPSLSIAPVTRPETLHLASVNAPEIMRRIARIAPASIERADLVVRATTPFSATALSHFRHLATGFGHVVERLGGMADQPGEAVRVRDVTRLSPQPFLTGVPEWAERIGLEWVDDPDALSVRRDGSARLGDEAVGQLVLADDDAILTYLDPREVHRIGTSHAAMAYIAESGHGVSDSEMELPADVLLNPQRDGTLAIHASDADGLADARIAAALPDGGTVRRAAARRHERFVPRDGAPAVGAPKRSSLYMTAGLGPLDVALAPVIARHICGKAQGFEAEWSGMRTPSRDMAGSIVAEAMAGAAA